METKLYFDKSKKAMLPETLNEFTADGGKFQMASQANGTWRRVWTRDINYGDHRFITIEGGVTRVMPMYHQGVVLVAVRQLSIEGGAEDTATESVTVWEKQFVAEDDAVEAVQKMRELL
jgi:hypothetical protein